MAATESVATLLSEAYEFLARRDLGSAQASMERALSVDFEDGELLYAMKCARWWSDVAARAGAMADPFEAGDFVMARWKAFRAFLERLGLRRERPFLAFKQYAFGYARSLYERLAAEGEPADPELALRLGRSRKGGGDYEGALRYLESAAKARKDDPALLAELADVFELVDETRSSKALFREAFFLNPQRVDVELLESSVVARLVARIVELGRTGHEVAEWIPVYGELLGAFSVKRELKPVEAGKLKQAVYELESELAADGSRRAILVPRLINRYFWLVDHLLAQKEEKGRIDELLLKIKLLDPNVYKQYIA